MFNRKKVKELTKKLKRYSEIQDLEKEKERLEKINRELSEKYEGSKYYLIYTENDNNLPSFTIKADLYKIENGFANFYIREIENNYHSAVGYFKQYNDILVSTIKDFSKIVSKKCI